VEREEQHPLVADRGAMSNPAPLRMLGPSNKPEGGGEGEEKGNANTGGEGGKVRSPGPVTTTTANRSHLRDKISVKELRVNEGGDPSYVARNPTVAQTRAVRYR